MDMNQLVDKAIALLWEVVSSYVSEITQVSILLEGIDYIDSAIIPQINCAEIQDSESFDIAEVEKCDGEILIAFEMPYILSLWKDREQLLRVTAVASGKCTIPDLDKFDWNAMDFKNMNKAELLSRKGIVSLHAINYSYVECDDVTV